MPNICVLRSIDLFSIHIWMLHHLSYNLKGNPDVCKSNPMHYLPLGNAGYQVWCCSSQILELISPKTRRNIFLHWQRCKNGEDCMFFLKNILIFFKYFNYACVCVCIHAYKCRYLQRPEKVLDPLELVLQPSVDAGKQTWSSARTACCPNHWTSLQSHSGLAWFYFPFFFKFSKERYRK